MNRIISVFAIFAFLKTAEANTEDFDFCVVKYFKGNGLLPSNFPEPQANPQNCEEIIEFEGRKFVGKTAKSIINEEDFSKYPKCIDSQSSIMDFSIFAALNEYLNYELLPLTEEDRKFIVGNITTVHKIIFQPTITSCIGEEFFGKMFEKRFKKDSSSSSSSSEEDDDTKTDYCLRKYLADNKIIAPPKYNFVVNPKNIDESNVHCTDVVNFEISKLTKRFEKDFRKVFYLNNNLKTVANVLNRFVEAKFEKNLILLEILPKLNLSPEEKSEEKRNFIDVMVEILASSDDF